MRMRQRQVTWAGDKALASRGNCPSPTPQPPDALDEVIQPLPRLAGVERQRHQTLGYSFRHRELAFPKTSLLECAGVVQGRVVRADFNALLVEHRVDEV